MSILQFQGDIDFVGVRGRPLDVDIVPGRPLSPDWGVQEAEPFSSDGFLMLDCVQMLSSGEFALLSARARAALEPIFDGLGEFLPVSLLGRAYWWFNCLAVSDCLTDAGQRMNWMGPERFFEPAPAWPFDAKRVAAAPAIFRVPQVPVGEVFVGEAVASAVSRQQLVGFDLRRVWPTAVRSQSIAEREDIDFAERESLIAAKRAAMAVYLAQRGAS